MLPHKGAAAGVIGAGWRKGGARREAEGKTVESKMYKRGEGSISVRTGGAWGSGGICCPRLGGGEGRSNAVWAQGDKGRKDRHSRVEPQRKDMKMENEITWPPEGPVGTRREKKKSRKKRARNEQRKTERWMEERANDDVAYPVV